MTMRITNDLSYRSDEAFAAVVERFEAAEPAPESFDATAALRRVLALAERYEATSKRRRQFAEKWQVAGRWQLADAFRNLALQSDGAADRIRAAVAGEQ